MKPKPEKIPMRLATTGNSALDALVDAVADRIIARMNVTTDKRLFTVAEAATYIGRSQKAVRTMVERGVLPAVRDGRRLHFDRSDLDQWIQFRKSKA